MPPLWLHHCSPRPPLTSFLLLLSNSPKPALSFQGVAVHPREQPPVGTSIFGCLLTHMMGSANTFSPGRLRPLGASLGVCRPCHGPCLCHCTMPPKEQFDANTACFLEEPLPVQPLSSRGKHNTPNHLLQYLYSINSIFLVQNLHKWVQARGRAIDCTGLIMYINSPSLPSSRESNIVLSSRRP